MKFTDNYLKQAQDEITKVFQAVRPELLKAHGNIEHRLKKDKSVVTELDTMVEENLRLALSKFDLNIGFMGEELGVEGDTKNFWLIDPIDGTESFIRGLPSPRNVVCLIADDKPVMAITYMFVTDELYVAIEGKGATRNGKSIHVSNRPLNRAWIEFAVPLNDPVSRQKLLNVRELIHGMTVHQSFTTVAEGSIDGLISYNTFMGIWDVVPRALLIREAGGKIANVGSDHYDYKNTSLVATNPVIFEKVAAVMAA